MSRCTRNENELAQSVYSKLKHLCTDEEISQMFWDHYKNGREQGFFVQTLTKKVAFAEFRRSDEIVVYYSHVAVWPKDNALSDEIYFNHRRTFTPDDIAPAAAFIRSYLFT